MQFRIKRHKGIFGAVVWLAQSRFDPPDAWSTIGKPFDVERAAGNAVRRLRAMHPISRRDIDAMRTECSGEHGDWFAYSCMNQESENLGDMVFMKCGPEHHHHSPPNTVDDEGAIYKLIGRVSMGVGTIHAT